MNRLFKRLKIQRINDHIWLLNDHDDGTGYLVTGTDKALVIDTMYGQEDLKEAVKTLTDLPLMLVNPMDILIILTEIFTSTRLIFILRISELPKHILRRTDLYR